jgi:hypothetical protein
MNQKIPAWVRMTSSQVRFRGQLMKSNPSWRSEPCTSNLDGGFWLTMIHHQKIRGGLIGVNSEAKLK